MNVELMHPRDQLVAAMNRIYHNGMTTLSGGNISIKDHNDDIWITPSGIDKGNLTPRDIMCIRADGTVDGPHRPSSELPFHRAIYRQRPDLNAIVHAHPPALITFSIVRKVPNTRIIPQANQVCGPVGYASYALPGSEQLGASIAARFAEGYNIVILENHGMAAAGRDLLDAFQRLETLDFCARTLIAANALGTVQTLNDNELAIFDDWQSLLPEFSPARHTSQERELRQQIVEIVHRSVKRHLMISTAGVVSARLDGESFLITPTGKDRGSLTARDIVLIHEGHREAGKQPSRSIDLHQQIYDQNPDIQCIMMAQSPSATAYAVTGVPFDSRVIPESYFLLRHVTRIPFHTFYQDRKEVARIVSTHKPVAIVQNDSVLTVGTDILGTFDRLEVVEFSAKSLIAAQSIGSVVPISPAEIDLIDTTFGLVPNSDPPATQPVTIGDK